MEAAETYNYIKEDKKERNKTQYINSTKKTHISKNKNRYTKSKALGRKNKSLSKKKNEYPLEKRSVGAELGGREVKHHKIGGCCCSVRSVRR